MAGNILNQRSRAEVELDLRGLPNPEPIEALQESKSSWRDGDTVRILADDECFVGDFLRWCAGRDYEVLSLHFRSDGSEVVLYVPSAARWTA